MGIEKQVILVVFVLCISICVLLYFLLKSKKEIKSYSEHYVDMVARKNILITYVIYLPDLNKLIKDELNNGGYFYVFYMKITNNFVMSFYINFIKGPKILCEIYSLRLKKLSFDKGNFIYRFYCLNDKQIDMEIEKLYKILRSLRLKKNE